MSEQKKFFILLVLLILSCTLLLYLRQNVGQAFVQQLSHFK
jgi:hypothetical protein